MDVIKLIVIASMFLFSSTSNAAIIDNNTFTTDTESGLDWLDVTFTVDRSYNDVSSQVGGSGDFEGWRYASRQEFDTLWFDCNRQLITR